MTDLFDTRAIEDDSAQWDALAARVAAGAVRESRERGGLAWLAETRGGWVAATLVLAAALAWLMVPAPSTPATQTSGDWVATLGPQDALGREVITLDSPPALALLLLGKSER